MKPLPDNILLRMSDKDRAMLGKAGQTADEAQAAYVAKNEKELHKQIGSLLALRGIWYCHSRTDRPTTQSLGVPDFICAVGGVAVAMEAKHAKGKLRPEQEQCRDAMQRNGWRWFLVRTLDEARAALDWVKETNRAE